MIYTQAVLTVDLKALVENYNFLKQQASHSIPAAVVKNNAYGLGIENVVPSLVNEGCNHFFVALANEGEKVRKFAKKAHIYVLQGVGEDSIEIFRKEKLTPVIATPKMWQFWKQNKVEGIRPVLNVETGLNRLGFRLKDIQNLSEEDKKEFSYILSHLSCADEPYHFMNWHQIEAFDNISKFFPKTPRTLSASDGLFLGEKFQKDMVRLGAAMYGLNTAPDRQNRMKNVVYLKAPVLQIEDVAKGEYIGYGASYKVAKNMKIAIVSVGYADGLPRSLAGRGRVFFAGQEIRMVGRLSMDNIMCDVTDIKNLNEGDFVDVLSSQYTADDMGQDAGTIGYEILNGILKSGRVSMDFVK
ncbi:MAG: alanine racemase [Alphaproteobacteria bacterium]|nr:alanine racemase [Alphaproteobacteria bacterium]